MVVELDQQHYQVKLVYLVFMNQYFICAAMTEDSDIPERRTSMSVIKSDERFVRSHSMWDHKFAEVEKQETQMMTTQWSMMREQLTVLTRNVAMCQSDLEDFKKSQANTNSTFGKQFQDAEDELGKERHERIVGDDRLDQLIEKLQSNFRAEVKTREESHDQLNALLSRRCDILEKQLSDSGKDVADAHQSILKLQSSMELANQKLDPLQVQIEKETTDRKALEDSLRGALREQTDSMRQVALDRNKDVDAQIKRLKESIERESDLKFQA